VYTGRFVIASSLASSYHAVAGARGWGWGGEGIMIFRYKKIKS